MSLYPSLEDMKVDQLARKQIEVEQQMQRARLTDGSAQAEPAEAAAPAASGLYAGLGLEELAASYGGLDLSEANVLANTTPDIGRQIVAYQQQFVKPVAAITPANDKHLARAMVLQGVKEVILAKDQKGKLGVAVEAVDKGVFVSFVWKDSAAALAGLRFGDQILQIDGQTVAGWNSSKVLKAFKQADPQRVSLAVRERPFCRVITVVKDHANTIGFLFKKGEVTAIVKDSSAARNGMLIHHQVTEVNGQCVVGMKDDDLLRIIKEADRSVSVTIMPSFVYKHIMNNIGSSMKKKMDHSIPEL